MAPTTNNSYPLAADAAHSSLKRARILFDNGNPSSVFLPSVDSEIHQASLLRRRRQRLGDAAAASEPIQSKKAASSALTVMTEKKTLAVETPTVETVPMSTTTGALTLLKEDQKQEQSSGGGGGILVKKTDTASSTSIPTPTWHAPWKLSTVLSSHLGWVRSIAMDPENKFFATGSADRTIKIWDFPKASVGANDALQLTLTGHISPVRGLAFSDKYPYLFSCGEDKQVKCWDLETNQVIRHYHGHLSVSEPCRCSLVNAFI